MIEILGTATIFMGIALILESIVTMIALRASNESYERYITEIKHSQKLEEKLKEKDRQYNDLERIIKEVSEEIEDGR